MASDELWWVLIAVLAIVAVSTLGSIAFTCRDRRKEQERAQQRWAEPVSPSIRRSAGYSRRSDGIDFSASDGVLIYAAMSMTSGNDCGSDSGGTSDSGGSDCGGGGD